MSQKKNSDSFYFIWSNWNFNVVQKRISEMLTRASSSDMMIFIYWFIFMIVSSVFVFKNAEYKWLHIKYELCVDLRFNIKKWRSFTSGVDVTYTETEVQLKSGLDS